MTEPPRSTPEPIYDRRADTIAAWRSIARFAFVIYVIAVTSLAYWCWGDASRWDSLSIRPDGSAWIVQVIGHLVSGVVRELVLFLILGLLAGAACVSTGAGQGMFRSLFQIAVAFVLSVAISVCVSVLLDGRPLVTPPFPMTLAIAVVCLWGCSMGSSWVRAESGTRWFLREAILLPLVVIGFSGLFLVLATTNEPLEINSQDVSTEDRRRLVGLLQGHDPRKLEEGTTTDLTLSENDLNQFASWGLSLLHENLRVGVNLTEGRVQFNAMTELPTSQPFGKYITLSSGGRVIARGGELGFLPDQFQIGRLRMPSWLLQISGPFVVGDEWRHDQAEPFFRSLKEIRVEERAVTVSYGPLSVKRGMLRETLVQLGVIEDLEASISAQMMRMESLAQQHDKLTFAQCMEAAFDEAQKRSASGQAARENRAAILTLSYLVGHSGVRSLLGRNVPSRSDRLGAALRGTSLRDRHDWVQHFTVSAALKVLSGASVSRDLGILKEELDADGGSGFSFGDLLADRSGTMLAIHATASEHAAAVMQSRIKAGFKESDFIPEGTDLPEGLTDDQMREEYGGVGGERYQRLVAEIDRRISECDAYRANQ